MKNLSRYDESLSVPRKKDVDAKQDTINVVGVLHGDGSGGISAAETTQAETIPIPAGILKGTASGGIEAATPGTDYAAPSLGLTGAAVGQAAAVKSVDADGKPTAWETKSFQAEPFTIHFTKTDDEISSDKTGKQIEAAFNAGLRVEAFLDGKQLGSSNISQNGRGYDFVDVTASGEISGVRLRIEYGDMLSGGSKTYSFLPVNFSCVEQPAFSGANELWGTDEDGLWGLIPNIDLSNLPAVTTDDNGKFLRVVSGAWAIAAIDNANGGRF